MTRAIVLRQYGAAEVLRLEEVQLSTLRRHEVRMRHTAVGVNFHDVYVRSGLYRTLQLPGIPGIEAVGIVEAVGSDVTHLAVGDRVAYVTGGYGAYAEARVIDAAELLRVPDELSDILVAGVLTKGLTAAMLLTRVHRVDAGHTCLVHAAAGGVGQLLCQWAQRMGARVIGTVGSEEKLATARRAGCAHVVVHARGRTAAQVLALTDGYGVEVAFDSVGQDTFDDSLESLAKRGHLVSFGQASGAISAFDVSRLATKSATLSRPILFHFLEDPGERSALSDRLFAALLAQEISAAVSHCYPLEQAEDAHRALESRATTGATILLP